MARASCTRARIAVGSLIVLSDGADVGSSLSAADVTAAPGDASAPGLRGRRALARPSTATRCARWPPGAAVAHAEADGGAERAVRRARRPHGREYLVTIPVLARLGGARRGRRHRRRVDRTATASYDAAPSCSPPGRPARAAGVGRGEPGATLLARLWRSRCSSRLRVLAGAARPRTHHGPHRGLHRRLERRRGGSSEEISDTLARRSAPALARARRLVALRGRRGRAARIPPERLAVVTLAGTRRRRRAAVVLAARALGVIALLTPIVVRLIVASARRRQRREFETSCPTTSRSWPRRCAPGTVVRRRGRGRGRGRGRAVQARVAARRRGRAARRVARRGARRVADRMRSEELAYVGTRRGAPAEDRRQHGRGARSRHGDDPRACAAPPARPHAHRAGTARRVDRHPAPGRADRVH